MNCSNRLDNAWTPDWDLGLQDEFDFGGREAAPAPSKPAARGWSAATAEVLNRQVGFDRRIGLDGSSLGSILAYFESLGAAEEGGSDE